MDTVATVSDHSQRLVSMYLRTRKGSVLPATTELYKYDLLRTHKRLIARGKALASASTEDLLQDIRLLRNDGAKGATIARVRSVLRGFYGQLVVQGVRADDPTSGVPSIRDRRPPPPVPLSEVDFQNILHALNPTTPVGVRNCLMLEVLQRTKIRCKDLFSLRVEQLDLERGVIHVAQRAGQEFSIPIQLIDEFKVYLSRYRPHLFSKGDPGYLFPTKRARPMVRQTLWHSLKIAIRVTGITRKVSISCLRRTH